VLLAETLGAADANGVDRAALLDILGSRGLASFTAHTAPAEETRYALAHAAKDLSLAQQDLGRPGVKLGMVDAARSRLADAGRAGLGGRDLSIYAQLVGTERAPSEINPLPCGTGRSLLSPSALLLFVSGRAASTTQRQCSRRRHGSLNSSSTASTGSSPTGSDLR
jgi:hypothetical protein